MICKSMVQACLSSIAVFTCASVAFANPNVKPHIALNLAASVVAYDAKGVEHDSPADVALKSGALLRYTVIAKNVGDAPARNLAPAARVPAGTVYEPTPSAHVSSATVEFSLDGGKTWSAVPTISVVTAHGTVRKKADPATYTAVRWVALRPLAPKSSLTYSYEVRVK